MDDLISRKALCNYALNQKDTSITPNDIMRFPSAQPGIIHCKDCKRYGHDNCFMKIQMLWELKPDDFCSQAERKADG